MFNQQIEKEVEDAFEEREKEKPSGNDSFERGTRAQHEEEKPGCIPSRNELGYRKRKHRLSYAVKLKDINMQWDLIAAGDEEGVIDFFQLKGKEATNMRGRSKITFAKKTKRLLKKALTTATSMMA